MVILPALERLQNSFVGNVRISTLEQTQLLSVDLRGAATAIDTLPKRPNLALNDVCENISAITIM